MTNLIDRLKKLTPKQQFVVINDYLACNRAMMRVYEIEDSEFYEGFDPSTLLKSIRDGYFNPNHDYVVDSWDDYYTTFDEPFEYIGIEHIWENYEQCQDHLEWLLDEVVNA